MTSLIEVNKIGIIVFYRVDFKCRTFDVLFRVDGRKGGDSDILLYTTGHWCFDALNIITEYRT